MSRAERLSALRELETVRHSRVLTYFLSDRESFPPGLPGIATSMASEPQLRFVDILRRMGHVERLDLLLYTRGGATESVWPLVNVLRSHCAHFAVLVPFRAHSAGTMVCLGADEVVMSDFAELSPIDPTTGNQFNPRDPSNPAAQYGISVEDVVAYFDLAEQRAHIESETARVEVLRQLIQTVHPLALGNVQRVYQLIRRLAVRLLQLHLTDHGEAHENHLDHIVDGLTKEFYSHVHAISRDEAINLMGTWIRGPNTDEQGPLLALFDKYVSDLHLMEKFNVPTVLGSEQTKPVTVVGGFIETTDHSVRYETELEIIQRPVTPGLPQGFPQPQPAASGGPKAYDFVVRRTGWTEDSLNSEEEREADDQQL